LSSVALAGLSAGVLAARRTLTCGHVRLAAVESTNDLLVLLVEEDAAWVWVGCGSTWPRLAAGYGRRPGSPSLRRPGLAGGLARLHLCVDGLASLSWSGSSARHYQNETVGRRSPTPTCAGAHHVVSPAGGAGRRRYLAR
jgi:hypothetical protein